MLKKLSVAFIILALLSAVCATTALAADPATGATVSVGAGGSYAAGQIVTASVTVTPTGGNINGVSMNIGYDPSVFSAPTVSAGSYNGGTLVWADVGDGTSTSLSFTLSFTVLAGAPTGNTSISATGVAASYMGTPVAANDSSAAVSITTAVPSVNTLSGVNVGTAAATLSGSTYTATVAGTVTSISVTATATDPLATVNNNGVTGTGTAACTKTLNYGTNTFDIVVTAQNGAQGYYKCTITRTGDGDNTLSSLTLSEGSISFASGTTSYAASVGNTVTSVKISATATKATSKVSIAGGTAVEGSNSYTKSLTYGSNKVDIVVTSQAGTTKTYTVNISRSDGRGDNNYLSALTVSNARIKFSRTVTSYSVVVPNSVTSVEIAATAEATEAKISGAGTKPVAVYSNDYKIVVTAENDDTRTYTLKVIRRDEAGKASANGANDHRLKSLSIAGIELPFDPDIFSYNVNADANVLTASVNAEVETSGDIAEIEAPAQLAKGDNLVSVYVMTGDNQSNVYTVTITKNESYHTLAGLATELPLSEEMVFPVEVHDGNDYISKAMLDAIRQSGKQVTVSVYDANGRVKYIWTLNGASMTEGDTEFDGHIEFAAADQAAIDGLIKNKGGVYLTFTHSGALPAGTSLSVNCSDLYQDGDTVYFYHYNPDSGKLETVAEEVMVSGGFATTRLAQCSGEYVISAQKTGGAIPWTLVGIIGGSLLVVGGAVALIIGRKRKAALDPYGAAYDAGYGGKGANSSRVTASRNEHAGYGGGFSRGPQEGGFEQYDLDNQGGMGSPQDGAYDPQAYGPQQYDQYGQPQYGAPQYDQYAQPQYNPQQAGQYGAQNGGEYDMFASQPENAPQAGYTNMFDSDAGMGDAHQQPVQQYGQPQYDAPQYDQYAQPQYGAPQYDQYAQPQYGAPQYDQYGQPQYGAPQYEQYNQPSAPQPDNGGYDQYGVRNDGYQG